MENNILISGISCKACGYFVFASKEDLYLSIVAGQINIPVLYRKDIFNVPYAP